MDVNTSRSVGRDAYDRALAASHREAALTLGAAVLIMAVFWAAVWFLKDSSQTILSMPIWFMASCVGGYLLSVLLVWLLVRFVFKDVPLDEAAAGAREGTPQSDAGEGR